MIITNRPLSPCINMQGELTWWHGLKLRANLDNRISAKPSVQMAHCMFVIEHGYCPSGMKESIADMYASYKVRGHNHIAESRVKELMELPEFPKR